jgi:hypothetical protein
METSGITKVYIFIALFSHKAVGVGQVYVAGNIQLRSPFGSWTKLLCSILKQSRWKMSFCGSVEPAGKNAVHVPSVSVAVWPPTVEGLHVVARIKVQVCSTFL